MGLTKPALTGNHMSIFEDVLTVTQKARQVQAAPVSAEGVSSVRQADRRVLGELVLALSG